MSANSETLKNTMKAAVTGSVDKVFYNARVVDVFLQRVFTGEVAISNGMIVGVLAQDGDPIYKAHEYVNCEGKYLLPGFIDAHVHIESSNITPSEYANVALSRGITTVVCDSHEIANVAGLDGLRFMIESAKRVPLDVKFMMPSCVPALDTELAGATITSKDMEDFLHEYPNDIFGLGEMMNLPGILQANDETLARNEFGLFKTKSKFVDGHAPMLEGKDLQTYVLSGVLADHESSFIDEALKKIAAGMFVFIREGTCSHNLDELISLVTEYPQVVSRLCFCTDDRSPGDALTVGLIDNAVKMAIERGVDPILAIKIATLNPSTMFGFDTNYALGKRGAIAPGRRADIQIRKDLSFDDVPLEVYVQGELVAHDKKSCFTLGAPTKLYERIYKKLETSVKLPKLDASIFEFDFNPEIPAIEVQKQNVVTKAYFATNDKDLRRIVVIERHGRAKEAQARGKSLREMVGSYIGQGFVKGYDITNGAVAVTVGHDSHNALIIGDNATDMLCAAQALGGGGLVVVSGGEILSKVDLALGGLMSKDKAEKVAREHDDFREAVWSLGLSREVDPEMGLNFLALPVIPEIRITPQGIFDVTQFELIG